MPIIVRDGYLDEIKEKRFDRVIKLLRSGRIFVLNQKELIYSANKYSNIV